MCENIIYRQEMIYLFSSKVCIQCIYLLYLPNYLAIFLSTYLPTQLSSFLPTYLPTLSSFLLTYLFYLPFYLPNYLVLSSFLPTYLSYPIFLSTYLIFFTNLPLNHKPMHFPSFISCSTRSYLPTHLLHSYKRIYHLYSPSFKYYLKILVSLDSESKFDKVGPCLNIKYLFLEWNFPFIRKIPHCFSSQVSLQIYI